MLNPEIYSTSSFHRVEISFEAFARVYFTIFKALISLCPFRSHSPSSSHWFIFASLMFIFIRIMNSGYAQWWTNERAKKKTIRAKWKKID